MVPKKTSVVPDNYPEFLEMLKQRIRSAQIKAAVAVNRELILLYWSMGGEISSKIQKNKWGKKIIQKISTDLKKEFPGMSGFSLRNLQYMRSFFEAYEEEIIMQSGIAQLPWSHNVTLLDKLQITRERIWYAKKSIENGWSRDVLILQIETGLFNRMGSALTNFQANLPKAESDLAQQILKDPYNFEFLTLSEDINERELERGLIEHIRDFLMELGVGFAFLGSQYPITVEGKDFKLDLLFYHTRLHCYIVIDLKIREFEPEFSGKMNFYVSAVDHLLKTDEDKPTIGIILCRSKLKTIVEFALKDIEKPIGVATYQLKTDLPKSLQDSLPTAKQLEIEIKAALSEIRKDKNQPNEHD